MSVWKESSNDVIATVINSLIGVCSADPNRVSADRLDHDRKIA
jgi:hypothetical protein